MLNKYIKVLYTLLMVSIPFTWATANTSMALKTPQTLIIDETSYIQNASTAGLPLLTAQKMFQLNGCPQELFALLPDGVSIEQCDDDAPLYPIQKNYRYGFITPLGQIVTPPIYNSVRQFHDGRARVGQDGKEGFVNELGQVVIEPIYDDANDFADGLAMVEQDGKVGYINTQGEMIIPLIYEATSSDFFKNFVNGFVKVNLAGKVGVIDRQNNVIIPFIYDWVYLFEDEAGHVFIEVIKNNKVGLLDSHGDIIIPIEYDRVGWSSEGLIAVGNFKEGYLNTINMKDGDDTDNENSSQDEDSGGFGYVNSKGEVVIPFVYDYANAFEGGLAEVRKNGKAGLINRQGDVVVPIQYKSFDNFHLSLANTDAFPVAQEHRGMFLMNRQGDRISEYYENIDPFYGNLAAAHREVEDENSFDVKLEAVLLNDRGEVVRRARERGIFLPIKSGKLGGYFFEFMDSGDEEGALLIDPDGEVVGLLPGFSLPSV